MSTNESVEPRLNATEKAKRAFPEADTNKTPTVYDPSPIPREPISARAKERLRRDVNIWSADITDRSQKIQPRAGPKKKMSAGEAFRTCLAHQNAGLQRADHLILRLRSELDGQHTERELAVQAQRQRRKRLEEFFDDITITARETPDRLVDEIQDWRKAMHEYDVIERANDRTHEVGALLNDARDWRG
ncbi:hypothetical protein K456DRAFT_1721815 [Colletotrichum gloeosporioides 23]|nr:hypothetical protein K456DRAFT_1721815 [Colletotrichum gloeosporioides 23]